MSKTNQTGMVLKINIIVFLARFGPRVSIINISVLKFHTVGYLLRVFDIIRFCDLILQFLKNIKNNMIV